jgi:hypothetical protein
MVRLYARQLFSALHQRHPVGSVHGNARPESVLLVPGSNSVIDFESGCFDGNQKDGRPERRFVRAPEV